VQVRLSYLTHNIYVPASGSEWGSFANDLVSYEFKIKLSDIGVVRDDIFGFWLSINAQAIVNYACEFPSSTIYGSAQKPKYWEHILLE